MPTNPEIQYNPETGHALWQTPRCGSTTLARWAYRAGYVRDDSFRDPDYTHHAIVRHPLDRYVSTVVLRFRNRPKKHRRLGYAEWIAEHVADRPDVYTDGGNIHFEPQWWFRRGMPNEHLTLLDDIEALIVELDPDAPPPVWWNRHEDLRENCPKRLVEEAVDADAVLAHYARDLTVWTSVADAAIEREVA